MDSPKSISCPEKLAFSSSLQDNTWHPRKDEKAYEWWYFDALSDDGSEGLIIVFQDNFIYSPSYNRQETDDSLLQLVERPAGRYPAVSFTYFRKGRLRYRFLTEFPEEAFAANEKASECKIGNCSFKFESAPYGSGYTVSINGLMRGNRRIEAHFEWLLIESDLANDRFCYYESAHCWNLVAPRADVTGRITVFDRSGRTTEVRHFRGTGYHDHHMDNRWLAKTIDRWHWGRAHFADASVVFCRYCEIGDNAPGTKMLLVRNGELQDVRVEYEEQDYARDSLGIRYPTKLELTSEDGMRLLVKPIATVDSSFFYLRFLSEMTLTLPDEVPRMTIGISEYISTRSLNYKVVNWLYDFRTGRGGRAPLI